jgi:hypothetical protein
VFAWVQFTRAGFGAAATATAQAAVDIRCFSMTTATVTTAQPPRIQFRFHLFAYHSRSIFYPPTARSSRRNPRRQRLLLLLLLLMSTKQVKTS